MSNINDDGTWFGVNRADVTGSFSFERGHCRGGFGIDDLQTPNIILEKKCQRAQICVSRATGSFTRSKERGRDGRIVY
jgi:hypothetical protein